VDWGDGIFGAQAAAEAYFGTDAACLTSDEAARLAAIQPNPHKWKAAHPGRYVPPGGLAQGPQRRGGAGQSQLLRSLAASLR